VEDARLKPAESPFEKEVMKTLFNKGYHVIPQLRVGSYRIDMVINDGDKRIAIECDGEKWHTQDDLPNDLKRQAILERLGWRFIRIRGSAYYRKPIDTMAEVFEELEKNGIYPNYRQMNSESNVIDEKDQTIITGIKLRAAEIRREWNPKNDETVEVRISLNQEADENEKVTEQGSINNGLAVEQLATEIKVSAFNKPEQTVIPGLIEQSNQLSIADIQVNVSQINLIDIENEITDLAHVSIIKPIHQAKAVVVSKNPDKSHKPVSDKLSLDSMPTFDFRSKNPKPNPLNLVETKNEVDKSQTGKVAKIATEQERSIIDKAKPRFDFRKN